jgi:hypothetical protein
MILSESGLKGDEIMKPEATVQKDSTSSQNLAQIMCKILIVYFISAAIVLVICFIFGWRSLEDIGTGFIYGSLGLALFGVLILAGNTVPAQLSILSLPAARPKEKYENDGISSNDEGRRFFFTTLICGVFLFVTGLVLKLFL